MAASLAPALKSILKSLPPGTSDQSKFNELAKRAIHETSTKGNDENRKSQWEHLLKNEIYTLAVSPNKTNDLPSHTGKGYRRDSSEA